MVPKILLMLPILFGQKYTVWPVTALALSARGLDNWIRIGPYWLVLGRNWLLYRAVLLGTWFYCVSIKGQP